MDAYSTENVKKTCLTWQQGTLECSFKIGHGFGANATGHRIGVRLSLRKLVMVRLGPNFFLKMILAELGAHDKDAEWMAEDVIYLSSCRT